MVSRGAARFAWLTRVAMMSLFAILLALKHHTISCMFGSPMAPVTESRATQERMPLVTHDQAIHRWHVRASVACPAASRS